MARTVAVRETDMATIVRAEQAVHDLDAIRIRLCYVNPDDEMLEDISEALADILAALGIAKMLLARKKRAKEVRGDGKGRVSDPVH